MPVKEMALNNQEELSGFIFMCNHVTKEECYRFRVFGLPAWRKEVVEKIQPGTYLFLFDCDTKLLYGIYTATSSGKLGIEELAFGGKFPAQVRFEIHRDCLPLPESGFKQAIEDNYQKGGHKFSPELNLGQVKNLLSLFRPISIDEQIIMPTSAPALSIQYQTSKNQLHLPAWPLAVQNTYSAGNSSSFGEPVPEPQSTYLNMPYQYYQPECRSLMNMGSSQTQSISDPHYVYQNVLNAQPNFNPYFNVIHVNPIMQSHASSSSNVAYHSDQTWGEYIPEAVTSTSYPYQGSSLVAVKPVEGIMHGDQQTGMGNEYYWPSSQTWIDTTHQQ